MAEEYLNWDRAVAWGETAEFLNSMLNEGCIGIEVSQVSARDNSFYDIIDGVHTLVEKVDLIISRVKDIVPAVTKIEKTCNPGHKFYPANEHRPRAFISIPKHLLNIEV